MPLRNGWTRPSARPRGNVVSADMFNRHRQDIDAAMAQVPTLLADADREWGELSGRSRTV